MLYGKVDYIVTDSPILLNLYYAQQFSPILQRGIHETIIAFFDQCKNDGSARGFYNEFLKSEPEPYRKTMELVGAKMRTEEGGEQLSGLGFSVTQRNELTVKVQSSFERILKIKF